MPTGKQIEREKRRDPERPSRRMQRQTEPADWAGADPALLVRLVINVTATGGAVRFGYTSDGGAYAIGFYDNNDKWTEYVRPSEDINMALAEMCSAWAV